ncbi:hypothetical protein LO772_01210 [Yinghuangia sp. ASG 101]|uniref:hypothetical protein n=1 Tax=Yinghuangia sp. ASG 101 TaxID=2896848 RepID=UPI001E3C0FAD|nr:hypothetical protein [Yinghuangia sp. ASG 101]UGQ12261.1 hypothetical protein LO772_01210 [Yinghuangia sp. ASG 101]
MAAPTPRRPLPAGPGAARSRRRGSAVRPPAPASRLIRPIRATALSRPSFPASPDPPRDLVRHLVRRLVPAHHDRTRSPMNAGVTPASGSPSCPVCTYPGSGLAETCPGCGRSPAGGEGADDTRALTMHQDLRAAVRATSDGFRRRDDRVLNALLQQCRGFDRLPEEARRRLLREQADAVDAADRRARTLRRARGAPEAAVARLAAGEIDRLLLLETGANGVSACTLTASPDGLVTAGPVARDVREWDDALPREGGRGRAELHFLAAGGLGYKGTPPDLETLAAWAGDLVAPDGSRGELVEHILVHRRAHWLLPALFATAVRRIAPPVAEFVAEPDGPGLAEWADELGAGVPLRRSYHLALASVAEPDGRVSVTTVELFGTGTAVRPGIACETEVAVARPPGLPGPAALPVLSRGGPDGEWAELAVAHADIPVPGQAVVVATLERPGRVRLRVRTAGGGPAAPGTRDVGRWPQSWAELAAALPRRYSAATGADVVVAVELAGPPTVVAERLEVLRTLAHALRASGGPSADAAGPFAAGLPGQTPHGPHAPPPGGLVRLAVIGYGDHSDDRRRADEDPCRVTDLTDPAAVLTAVRDWQALPVVDQFAAPVEDALHRAVRLDWRPGTQRTLVVLGSRPASLTTRAGSVVHARVCPKRLDWTEALDMLCGHLGVRTFAMVDEPPWMSHPDPAIPHAATREMWRRLGADGRFTLGSAGDVRALSDDVVPTTSVPLALPVRAPGPPGGPALP